MNASLSRPETMVLLQHNNPVLQCFEVPCWTAVYDNSKCYMSFFSAFSIDKVWHSSELLTRIYSIGIQYLALLACATLLNVLTPEYVLRSFGV